MLEAKMNEILELTESIIGDCMKTLVDIDTIKCMDADEFVMYKNCMRLMEATKELAIMQAATLDSINSKIDKLLEK